VWATSATSSSTRRAATAVFTDTVISLDPASTGFIVGFTLVIHELAPMTAPASPRALPVNAIFDGRGSLFQRAR
jgi:hypothetical protein